METKQSPNRLERITSIFRINSTFMLLPKAAYFFYLAFYGVVAEFNTIFLKDIGLTPKQAGFINGLRSVPMILGSLFFTTLADRTGKHTIIVPVLTVSATLTIISVPWIAAINGKQICQQQKIAPRNTSFHAMTTAPQNLLQIIKTYHTSVPKTHIPLNQSRHLEKVNIRRCHDEGTDHNGLYQSMLVTNLITALMYGPLQAFTDSIVSKYVELSPSKASLSRQLSFAYLGWAAGCMIVGPLADFFPISGISPYGWCFVLSTACLTIYGIIMLQMYSHAKEDRTTKEYLNEHAESDSIPTGKAEDNSEISEAYSKQMKSKQAMIYILTNWHVQLYFMTVLIISAAVGVYAGFLFIFLRGIGSSNINLSLTSLTMRSFDMMVCSFADRIIKLVGGELQAMALSYFIFAIRSMLVSSLQNPWLVILYVALTPWPALSRASSMRIITTISPKHLTTVMFSLYNSTWITGLMIGNILGGIGYERYGGGGLYKLNAALLSSWSVLLLIYKLIFKANKLKEIGEAVNKSAKPAIQDEKNPVHTSEEEVVFITNV